MIPFTLILLRSSAIMVLHFALVQSHSEINNEIPREPGSAFVAYPIFGRYTYLSWYLKYNLYIFIDVVL